MREMTSGTVKEWIGPRILELVFRAWIGLDSGGQGKDVSMTIGTEVTGCKEQDNLGP